MSQERSKVAVITGASAGIGAVYADRLARRGYDLLLVARSAARLTAIAERLSEETGQIIEILPLDLTDADNVRSLEVRLESDPSIAMLVNNAGLPLSNPLVEADVAEIQLMIALNITAPTLLARAAGRAFLARGSGAIINIASTVALFPETLDGPYNGSKAYLINLTQTLAHQLGPKGLRIQVVLPGITRTEIWELSGKDIGAIPADMVMETGTLVDAALAGFDLGEIVTIPTLEDLSDWNAMEAARLAMRPFLSRRGAASRYGVDPVS